MELKKKKAENPITLQKHDNSARLTITEGNVWNYNNNKMIRENPIPF